MKTYDNFLRRPPSRRATFSARLLLLALASLLGYYCFLDPRVWAWGILALLALILLISFAFTTFVVNARRGDEPLFVIARAEYRRQLFPLNYSHLADPQKVQKFDQNLRGLKEVTSFKNIAKKELLVAMLLFLSVYCLASVAFFSFAYLTEGSADLAISALLALDSIAKGSLFDLLESFNVSITSTDLRDTLGYSSISLATRTTVSLLVIRQFLVLYKALQARRAYKSAFADLNSTINFLFSLRFELQSWRESLPNYYGKFPTLNEGVAKVVQVNWDASGHNLTSEPFEDVYAKFRHRTYTEALEIEYLNVILDYDALSKRAKDAEALTKLRSKYQEMVQEVTDVNKDDDA